MRDRHGDGAVEPTTVCTLKDWLDCIVPGDRRRLKAKLLKLPGGATRQFETQFRMALPDGRQLWTDMCGIVVRDAERSIERVIGHISKLQTSVECKSPQLLSPFHDPLTGLPNRWLFNRCLADAVELGRNHSDYRFAMLFVNLDGFKAINDQHGHLVGDQTLTSMARRLVGCVRDDDVVARRDGDEFTVLVRDVWQLADATAAADRILEQFRQGLAVAGNELRITASIGIAVNGAESTVEELTRAADAAMYRAKARGGNCHVIAGSL